MLVRRTGDVGSLVATGSVSFENLSISYSSSYDFYLATSFRIMSCDSDSVFVAPQLQGAAALGFLNAILFARCPSEKACCFCLCSLNRQGVGLYDANNICALR